MDESLIELHEKPFILSMQHHLDSMLTATFEDVFGLQRSINQFLARYGELVTDALLKSDVSDNNAYVLKQLQRYCHFDMCVKNMQEEARKTYRATGEMTLTFDDYQDLLDETAKQ